MSNAPSHSESLAWDLPDRLRKALRVADVSVAEMAAELDVSRNTVGNYLAGRSIPPTPTIKVWALRCGVPYAWLKDGVEPEDGPDGGPDLRSNTSGWIHDFAGQDAAGSNVVRLDLGRAA